MTPEEILAAEQIPFTDLLTPHETRLKRAGFVQGYTQCQSEIARLQRVVNELQTLWAPVDDYVRYKTNMKLGESVATQTLKLIKQVQELKDDLERMQLQSGDLTPEQVDKSKLTWYACVDQVYEHREQADRTTRALNRATGVGPRFRTYKIIEL